MQQKINNFKIGALVIAHKTEDIGIVVESRKEAFTVFWLTNLFNYDVEDLKTYNLNYKQSIGTLS